MANETLTFRPSKKNGTILAQLAELAEQENRSLNNYKVFASLMYLIKYFPFLKGYLVNCSKLQYSVLI